MAGVSFSPAFCLCHWSRYNRHCHWSLSLEPVLFRPHSHFYSLPQLLMQVGLWATTWALRGQLWVPTGLCRGAVRSGAGVHEGVLRWVGTGFLYWGSVLAPWAVVPGVRLGFLASLVAVTVSYTHLTLPTTPYV